MAQGMALLHQELAEAMPGIVLAGERLHEATFAYEGFAQRPLMRGHPLTPHLISIFLFSPFVHAIGFSTVPDHDPVRHNEILRHNEFVGAHTTAHYLGCRSLGSICGST